MAFGVSGEPDARAMRKVSDAAGEQNSWLVLEIGRGDFRPDYSESEHQVSVPLHRVEEPMPTNVS